MDLTIKRPRTMTHMLRNRIDQANDLKIESIMVEGEYRTGINDPSRAAAQWERMKGIKKVIGKKAIVADYMRRVNGMRDNNLQINYITDLSKE